MPGVIELELLRLADHRRIIASAFSADTCVTRSILQENYRRRRMGNELPLIEVIVFCQESIEFFRANFLAEFLEAFAAGR